MPNVMAFYNDNPAAAKVQHGDPLRLLSDQIVIQGDFLSDQDICRAVFAKTSREHCTDSLQLFNWFVSDLSLRSMRAGDVITITRGSRSMSYSLSIPGFVKLATAVLHAGPYVDPYRVPHLWNDNAEFVRHAKQVLEQIGKIRSFSISLVACRVEGFNPFTPSVANSWSIAIDQSLVGLWKSQVTETTPLTLSDELSFLVHLPADRSKLDDLSLFLELLDEAKSRLEFCLRFTESRVAADRAA